MVVTNLGGDGRGAGRRDFVRWFNQGLSKFGLVAANSPLSCGGAADGWNVTAQARVSPMFVSIATCQRATLTYAQVPRSGPHCIWVSGISVNFNTERTAGVVGETYRDLMIGAPFSNAQNGNGAIVFGPIQPGTTTVSR